MKQNLHGSLPHARYYAACVTCALAHMHERFIIYRDLKQENLLLDPQGRLKVVDMGLAKFVIGKTYTVLGVPAFFAPEMCAQSGYTTAVDWWALGILVFEMLAGTTPFQGSGLDFNARRDAYYFLWTQGLLMDLSFKFEKNVFKIPAKGGAREFLQDLLVYEPTKRLPCQPDGLKKLMAQPFFEDIDWESLRQGQLQGPYVPGLLMFARAAQDHLDECTQESRPFGKYRDDGSGWDADF